jgi:hypothetical protein
MTTSARPDNIPSATTLAQEPSSSFSEIACQALRRRYLEKRKRTGEEAALPGGMRLRQRTAQPAICNGTPGYTALKKRIDALDKEKDDREIFRLLYTLSEWEKSVNRPFPFVSDEDDKDDEEKPVEVIDLIDDQDVIDVESYILGVLLVNVVKAEHVDDEHTNSVDHVPTQVVIKQEEGDNLPRETQEDKSSQPGVLDMSSSPEEPAKKRQRSQYAVQDDFITELKRRREEMSKKVLGTSFAILRSRRRRSRHWKEQCCMSELEDQKIELYKLEKEIEQYENVTRSKTR